MIADATRAEYDDEDLLLERDSDRYRVAPCPTGVKDEMLMKEAISS
jgi:hypothetical protein